MLYTHLAGYVTIRQPPRGGDGNTGIELPVANVLFLGR